MEGHTDLYRLDNGTLTAITVGIRMKSLDPLSDPTLVQWVLGSSWCTTMPGLMWREYAGSSWRMKELIPLTGPHALLT